MHARLLALAAIALLALPARAADGDLPEVPFTRKVLGNGLTVIVSEDPKAPVVAVDVWYHVGSKNERPGRTGFAHLFEHLMFNGSEHANDDWFHAMARFGATGVNGTTNNDRTNYFETVPTGALDAVLWLESDRMGHLLGAIDQGKLDEQRGVVQNEKRQGENRPYSSGYRMLPSLCYPAGHPLSWQVIGSMADLDAASLDDVKEWFRAYYGAANAVVVVCGDVKTEEALAKVERYFGDIPPGPTVTRPGTWVAKRTVPSRAVVQERVPQGRILKAWNTPEWGSRDSVLLGLAASVLARGEGSRLQRRLVRQEALATEVEAEQDEGEIGSLFLLSATAAEGADLARVEAVLDEEVARLAAEGPTAEELAIEKAQVRATFLRGLERIGGFGGKADLLAMGQTFAGRPDAWKDRMALVSKATPADVGAAVARWLDAGALAIETRPFPALAAAKSGADRSAPPPVADPPEARFPAVQRATLPNGMRLVVARRPALPLVRFDLLVDAGYTADPPGLSGIASLAGALLASGTEKRDALAVRREADRLGALTEVTTDADSLRITLEGLRESLAPSLDLLADVALHPAFPPGDLEIHRRARLAAIQQERVDARGMASRLLPRLLFGAGHPSAAPFTGTGSPGDVARITREDLRAFHGSWFRPEGTTLVVTGDATLEELLPLVGAAFTGWPDGKPATKTPPAPPPAGASRIYLLDRPGAPQSLIVGATLVAPRGDPVETPLAVLNAVLGGSFGSRLNMNLREGKGWSYGARSQVRDARGPRVLQASAPVQTDKTAESLAEMAKEMRAIAGGVPPTEKEIAAAKATMTLTLPGRWEASRAVAESLVEILTHGLPDGWLDGYAARVRAVGPADLAAAGKQVRPESLVWLVIGDRKKVEQPVRDLGLAEVVVVDPEGRPVE